METGVPTSNTTGQGDMALQQLKSVEIKEYLTPEAIIEVWDALRRKWAAWDFNYHREQLRDRWTTPDAFRGGSKMTRVFPSQLRLKGKGNGKKLLYEEAEALFGNKTTIFYWMEGATTSDRELDAGGPVILVRMIAV
jgi:hypothetical protein